MSSPDNRIVSMTFDNESFERKLSATLDSLDKLSKSLAFDGAQKGFDNISNAAASFDLSHMGDAVDNISSHFNALGAVAFTVIQDITRQGIQFAQNVADQIINPLITGGKQRAINIEQAKFQFQGLGIDIQKAMDSALIAVKGTAFGLDDAAKAAAQFGASGVKVGDDMTRALRAISGAAALTGTSYQEMAQIFTSSAGTGVVNNQDLLQFGTRGLNAAAAVAKQLGITEAQVHQLARDGKLDFATFAKAMDDAFGAHATEANQTYTGSLANLHAALARVGASFFGPKLDQERDLFNALSPVIDKINEALQPLIRTFLIISGINIDRAIKSLGALDLTNLKTGLQNIGIGFINLAVFAGKFGSIVKEAFREIFPKSATSNFIQFVGAFVNFTEKFKMGGETADKVKSIFKGFFSIVDIGFAIFKGVLSLIGSVIKALLPAGAGLLNFGATTGDTLTKLDEFLVKGGRIHDFFQKLGDAISAPIKFFKDLKTAISEVFNSDNTDKFEQGFGRVQSRFDHLSGTAKTIAEHLSGILKTLDTVWEAIKNWFSELGSKVADAFKPGDFSAAVDIVNLGLIGGLVAIFHKFLSGDTVISFNSGLVTKIKTIFGQLSASLSEMQLKLKAEVIMRIAEAVAILTVSLVALSLIDSKNLTKALVAMGVGFGELIAVMTLLDKLNFASSAAKMAGLAAALILIATAAGILTISIALLSRLDITALGKGLVGVAVGLTTLSVSTQLIATDSTGLIAASVAMIGISTAMLVLSKAIASFSGLSWGELAKGLVGVAGGLIAITTAMKFMPKTGVLQGLGFLEISAGLLILAKAVQAFSGISWGDMAKGFLGIGFGLSVIGDAMSFMPTNLPITAGGLVILSAALLLMAEAVKKMGAIDLGTLAKGVGAFAVMLVILVGAMNGSESALPGAAAMVVMAGALDILANVLKKIGQLSIAQIVTGIATIAVVIGGLALAATLGSEAIPFILLLGIALGSVGIGFALFGAGAILVAKSFEIMAKSGVTGAKSIVESIKVLLEAIPDLAALVAITIVTFAEDILKAVPLLVRVIAAVLSQVIESVTKLVPEIAKLMDVMLSEFLKLVRDRFPDIVNTGFEMLVALLTGFRNNIGEITTLVVEIITGFIDALTLQVPTLIDSVTNLIQTIIMGVVIKLGEMQIWLLPKGIELIGGLLIGIIQALPDIVNWFINLPGQILVWIGDATQWLLGTGINTITGFLIGIIQHIPDVFSFLGTLASKIPAAVGNATAWLLSKGIDVIEGLYQGVLERFYQIIGWFSDLKNTVTSAVGDLSGILIDIGKSVIEGLLNGMKSTWETAKSWLSSLNPADWFNDINPKKGHAIVNLVSTGLLVMQGLRNGMQTGWKETADWLKTIDPSSEFVDKTTENLNSAVSKVVDRLGSMDLGNFNPVITPVLDLSKIESASKDLEALLKVGSISPDVSFSQAKQISTTTELDKTAGASVVQAPPADITFNQNNYSPEALSTNDIYRQTKSQIALAKEELNI